MTSSALALPRAGAPAAAAGSSAHAPVVVVVVDRDRALVCRGGADERAASCATRSSATRRTTRSRDLIAGTLTRERPVLPAPHQVVETFADDVFGWPVDFAAQSRLSQPGSRCRRPSSASLLGAMFGIMLAVSDRACAHAAEEPAALDHLLADGADPRGRAHRHRRAGLDRAARAAAEGDHFRLSVLFPGHHRHGERADFARSDPARSDAHLVGDAGANILEAALAVVGAVSCSPA